MPDICQHCQHCQHCHFRQTSNGNIRSLTKLHTSLRASTDVNSNQAMREAVGPKQKADHITASFYLVCTQHGLRGSLD